ncbi:hypothetical protein ON010_g18667 [Phytophthora cinnamomi]|nr:hypothetical protein ON010_g18667 [Phytophthora cinnamomi]
MQVLFTWSSNLVADYLKLVNVVIPWEERRATEKLRENASRGPNVNCFRVLSGREHDLWRAIPARDDVFRELHVVLLRRNTSRQAEIAHFQVAIRVQQQI